MKIILFVLIILLLTNTVNAQEILSIDNSRSYVINIDDAGKKYPIEDFLTSNKHSFIEGQKLEAHFFFIKTSSSNPRDSYGLEVRTELKDPEWQYKIYGETKSMRVDKWTVWNNSRDHLESFFEIVLYGRIPKPSIKIEEPNFKDYTGEGPGLRNTELSIFTVYDGTDAKNKIQDAGAYNFISTNSNIKDYLDKIQSNLDTSNLNINHINALNEQKEYISGLSRNGHVGLAYDLSKSFAKIVEYLRNNKPENDDNKGTMLIAIVVGITLAVITGIAGYKIGQGGEKVSPELINQMDRSYNTLKQNADKLEKINISSIPGAEKEAADIESIKRQITPSIAGLKNILNQLR
ncbi:MAG: hypothetical protein FIB07_14435 [Candidatus Methanoperedens sp.]|nr:hypothetical protein [Candidatus Methanoperedens sp.]